MGSGRKICEIWCILRHFGDDSVDLHFREQVFVSAEGATAGWPLNTPLPFLTPEITHTVVVGIDQPPMLRRLNPGVRCYYIGLLAVTNETHLLISASLND